MLSDEEVGKRVDYIWLKEDTRKAKSIADLKRIIHELLDALHPGAPS